MRMFYNIFKSISSANQKQPKIQTNEPIETNIDKVFEYYKEDKIKKTIAVKTLKEI
jgi:hypothetical protein